MGKLKEKRITPITMILFLILFLYAAMLISMYLWGFFTSLKTNRQFSRDVLGLPPGLPWAWQWKNYIDVFSLMFVPVLKNGVSRNVYLSEMVFNSLFYSLVGSVISIFTLWMMAYLFAKFPYKLSKFLYAANLVIMIVPIIGTLPSALMLYKELNLYDTWGFVVVDSIGFTGMYLLIFYAFHKGIGKEFTDAAYVDGANNWSTMMRIVFPISSQMFFVVLLLSFIGRWNDYMTMVLYMPSHPTIAYGIYRFSTVTTSEASWAPMQITGCVILMIPILVTFLFFQKQMMGNLRAGAIKG